MEQTEKLTNTKQVIAYIAERFPLCFTLEGEARPLKIGIFQDLVARLEGDEQISKTQLRAALRQYTSSWRYLYGAKEGAQRVDLDGNDCGLLEQEHIDHAKQSLTESKAKVAERRKAQAIKNAAARPKDEKKVKTAPKSTKPTDNKTKSRTVKAKNTKLDKQSSPRRPALLVEEIVVGRDVSLNMGNGYLPAKIEEVNKDGVRVRLTNGLSMLVKAEHLSA